MGELITQGVKWAFIIGASLTFMTAITTIVSLIVSGVSTGIIGEILGVMSNCLPFSAGSVIGGVFTAGNAVLSFLVAQKLYNLTTEHVKI